MANPIGYLLNDDLDLTFSNGDFAKGESVVQEAEVIVRLNKGELKYDPLFGTNLIAAMKTNDIEKIKSAIKEAFKLDKKRIKDFEFKNGTLKYTVEHAA